MALDLLCQEMKEACQESSQSQFSQCYGILSHLGRAVTVLERSVVRKIMSGRARGSLLFCFVWSAVPLSEVSGASLSFSDDR